MINNVECRKDGQSVSSGELLASQSEVFETAVFTSTGDEMLSLLKGVWLEQACDSGSLVAGSISLHQTALKVSALNSRCPCMAAVKARRIVVDHCLRWLSHFLVESPNCVAHIIAVQSAHMCLAAIFFFCTELIRLLNDLVSWRIDCDSLPKAASF